MHEKSVRDDISDFLFRTLPGKSSSIVRLRWALRNFAEDLLAKNLLLLGPIGIGKTTLARVVAVLRFLVAVRPEIRKPFLEALRFDRHMQVAKTLINWYEDINLTGMTEFDAAAQLFGVAPNAFTGVDGRIGILESAALGHMPKTQEAPLGARITGGVVLLDEIGDLPLAIQPKLLAVLTGAEVFRTGGEGNKNFQFSYFGSTVSATWHNLTEPGRMRPDLLSRISDHVINIPGLDERVDDLPEIVPWVVEELNRCRNDEIQRLRKVIDKNQSIDKARLESMEERALKISDGDMKLLMKCPWSSKGQLRGLRQILQRVIEADISVSASIDEQQNVSTNTVAHSIERIAEGMVALLKSDPPRRGGLSKQLSQVEREVRLSIRERLLADEHELAVVAKAVGLEVTQLKTHVYDLGRNRTSNDAQNEESS